MFHFTALPPLALYIHIPWCVRKCPYCDFNSHALDGDIPDIAYVDCLLADLEQDLPSIWGRVVSSIFIGGGTPSLLSAEALDRLLSGLRMRLSIDAYAEITLEANPGTLESGKFHEFRAAGINRLSIGCQSFHDEQLQALGRIHDRKAAIRAAETAHEAGLDNFNLDLMFGLPGQFLPQALADIETAMALEPAHISYYQLTLEPNTLFHHSPPPLPEDDTIWGMQTAAQQALAKRGYGQYEISAYARDGQQSRHNLNYWQFGDYLGIGAGAHGKVSAADTQNIRRSWKQKHPASYMAGISGGKHVAERKLLSPADAGFEFMLNALRLKAGFPTRLFNQHTGLPITVISDALAKAEQRGLLEHSIEHIRPTETGYRFYNDLAELFLVDNAENET
ncbi:radical SAM family heme chaperone HemW [Sulfuriflexus mobilis]|uniref:radical SAM family heme chaperone HemW n=1 Tax=Sulfuriflexus mobilis TaxID=1811807 RepID=UPI000F84A57A|nr:radical SAM family heme chaperone HemW [Sulfuriflexus mobilis]